MSTDQVNETAKMDWACRMKCSRVAEEMLKYAGMIWRRGVAILTLLDRLIEPNPRS